MKFALTPSQYRCVKIANGLHHISPSERAGSDILSVLSALKLYQPRRLQSHLSGSGHTTGHGHQVQHAAARCQERAGRLRAPRAGVKQLTAGGDRLVQSWQRSPQGQPLGDGRGGAGLVGSMVRHKACSSREVANLQQERLQGDSETGVDSIR